jgi:pentatricopeptide repeat protein
MKEKDIKMNEVLYTNAMVACLHGIYKLIILGLVILYFFLVIKGNNYEGALQLFEEARQCPDIQLNHFLYTNALVAFMRSFSFFLTFITFRFYKSCLTGGQYQKALDVYEQMKQNSLQISAFYFYYFYT